MDTGLDKSVFNDIWGTLVAPRFNEYKEKFENCVDIDRNAYDLIWERYKILNLQCKHDYMSNPDGLLDRHKVAACYLIAIVQVKPVRFIVPLIDHSKYYVCNEKIAISVAMAIVRAYVMATYAKDDEKMRIKFEDGLRYPPEKYVHHGKYLHNFTSEIYFANRDGKLNILSIAHELFLLEVITAMSDIE